MVDLYRASNGINDIIDYIKKGFIEKDVEAKLIVASIVLREPLLMIGEPGTAKSAIVLRASSSIGLSKEEEAKLNEFIERQLTKKGSEQSSITVISDKINNYYKGGEDYKDIVKDIFKVYKNWKKDPDEKADMVKEIVNLASNNYFGYQLNKFTDISELVGNLNLEALAKGKQETFKNNSIMSANVVFLDEIYKSSSSIRNALLSAMNERYFSMNGKKVPTHIWTMIGTSNEIDESDEAMAFNDRFVFKIFVNKVSKDNEDKLLTLNRKDSKSDKGHIISNADLIDITNFVGELADKNKSKFSEFIKSNKDKDNEIDTDAYSNEDADHSDKEEHEAFSKLMNLLDSCDEEGILLSDRKKTKLVGILTFSAISNGRSYINKEDLRILKYVLANNKDEYDNVDKLIDKTLLTEEDVIKELTNIKTGIESYEEKIERYESGNAKDKKLLDEVGNKIVDYEEIEKRISYFNYLYDTNEVRGLCKDIEERYKKLDVDYGIIINKDESIKSTERNENTDTSAVEDKRKYIREEVNETDLKNTVINSKKINRGIKDKILRNLR